MKTDYSNPSIAKLIFSLILLVLFFSLSQAQQSGTIKGSINNATNGNPLPGANVGLVGSLIGVSSDAEGDYLLNLPEGNHRLQISFVGFKTVHKDITIKAGESLSLKILLEESILEFGENIVVLGSRAKRTAIQSPVPIDVISAKALEYMGSTELNQALHYIAPSFNASPQTISDGTDHINPASLRGLGPDQVLVLINGKRRHTSALVHVNGTFGRGTVGVDLNAIPTSAVQRIEVLRDGASAQYGSDAIAGVINIVLKEQTDDILISAGSGLTGEGDGEQVQASVNYGAKIGEDGFINITGEFLSRNPTNRSEAWSGDIFPGISGTANTDAELNARGKTREDFSMKTGQSGVVAGATFFNAKIPLGEKAEFYSSGGVSHRKGEATGFYRLPNSEARVNLDLYPNGFLPQIHSEVGDASFTAGVKGMHNDWIIDASITHGGNSFQFNIENTMNASLGSSSPISFDAGNLSYSQSTANLDLLKKVDTGGMFENLMLAFGAEYRLENYQIFAGEDASWQLGNGGTIPGVDYDTTATGSPKQPGSQVFPGFQPVNEVDRYRNSIGVYVDLEADINDKLQLGLAGRYENYSDFGETFNGKFTFRYEFLENYAFRGAISNGFRAPSLHQLYFNNVSIQFVIDPNSGELTPSRVLTARNSDPITKAFGIHELKEEKSLNISFGITAQPFNNLLVTADYYSIQIDDRIVLTSRFSSSDGNIGSQVSNILEPFKSSGVTAAQFFANAVDTRTKGLDLVAAYTMRFQSSQLTITGAANLTSTEVESINIPASVAHKFTGGDLDAVRSTLFNREERNRLEDALPHQKYNVSFRYEAGPFAATLRGNYFGSIEYKPTDSSLDEIFNAKTIFDVSVAYELLDGVKLTLGANNVLNAFPDKHTKDSNLSGGRFIYSRRVTQFGMNGGYYYAGLKLSI